MGLKLVKKPGRLPYYLRGTVNGVRYDETTYTTDANLANQIRVKRESDLMRERIYGKASTATFAQAVLHYLEHGGAKRFMEPVLLHFANTPLSNIRQEAVDDAARRLYPQASGSTRNRQVYGVVGAVLRHAASLGWCELPTFKRPSSPAGRVRWLSKADADRLVAACSSHLRPLVVFMLYTGARVGEALWLDWSNVDLERRHVQFIDTKNGTSRGVPLHPLVVNALGTGVPGTGEVFRRPDGAAYARPTQLSDTSAGTRIKTGFKAACRRAGIEDFHPHDCRHTWATWHYQANRDLGALMRLGGWKTMSMVMRYAHTNVGELAHTIDAL